MTENFATTSSQLAPHRYVPYHFKGLRPGQIEGINNERNVQVETKKAEIKNQNSEEYQWAVQNLANNQHFLNNEIDLQAKKDEMAGSHRDQHLVDKVAKDERWPNMYGDLNSIPDVQKDMVGGANVRAIK